MRSFIILGVALGQASLAMGADRFDPSGSYELSPAVLSVMTAGSKAIAIYWGYRNFRPEEVLDREGPWCGLVLEFERVADGLWKSSDKPARIRMSAIGTKFEMPQEVGEFTLTESTKDTIFAYRDPPELCRVVGKTTGPLKVGMTVAAIYLGGETGPGCLVPEFVESIESGKQDDDKREIVRARIGSVDKLFVVPESWLDCTNARPAGGQSKRQIAHASALALFKLGKQQEAAEALHDGVGGSPYRIGRDEVEIFNDLGFFLEQAKRYKDAVEVLKAVLEVAPDRMVAYLNIGDAFLGLNDVSNAKAAYKEYQKRMLQSGKGSKIPKRIQQYLDKD